LTSILAKQLRVTYLIVSKPFLSKALTREQPGVARMRMNHGRASHYYRKDLQTRGIKKLCERSLTT